jgi:hypothetical protein
MPVKFLCASSPNLLGCIVHAFIASGRLVDPLPFGDFFTLVINAGFFCWYDRRHPHCPPSLLSWFLCMFFSSFIFSLPSALPPPFPVYGFVILRPDISYINCTAAWSYNFVHFVNLSPHLLVINLLVEPLISYPTMAPKKNPDAASKASTATPYELLHFIIIRPHFWCLVLQPSQRSPP